MKKAATVLVAIVALEHIYILVLEMFLWTQPAGLRAFNLTPEFAEQTAVLAANQGLYNGFLAAGLIWGLITGATLEDLGGKMGDIGQLPKREFRSRQELRDWLEANHGTADSFWLVSFKKHVADRYLPYDAIVEELLCFGWIDGRTRRLDDDRTMLLAARRKPGSTWSASNKKRVAKLENAGLLTAAGREKIDDAKRDGSWSFLDDVENVVIPEDLSSALKRNGAAAQEFEAFSKSAKKVILLWIKTAKRSDTRTKRVNETVRLAAMGLKAAHPEAQGR